MNIFDDVSTEFRDLGEIKRSKHIVHIMV